MANFRHYTKLAMELSKEDCGRVVSVVNESWTIVGVLHRVDNRDAIDFDDFRMITGRRTIECWLTVGPWKAEVDPRTQVTVEVPALPSGEVAGDVIQGEILA
ncbi:hypothetical protein SEA_KINGBOB_25 [Arthrobacter phage KingBob]|uniref:Uncharacterized protein n=1 Tax=Arthrobacter phage Sergei TaxID=2250416 RepID=A0A345KPW3_9CAUD|nr:hypothetical protein KDJ06_gp25 [Arthrobacter phage Sergei]ASZ74339.1 hypothetical protein TEMPER16_25 [Arthrobacter phage Temper16]AXH43952.1 hypothetical protein SEA_DAIBOJU_25 [Arthrobacter phage Daiboju]AXH44014.1 hypothetical protein SEA_HERB_25 [Arthrobacter phage Herb]AXH44258.1 hypothetical protein SEA_KINGBOB_25 [Arthrobacter phage KingBob]QGJ97166.1 hypothetical protein SEA_MARIA1952_25 [Arthrobacter phage Maria1952]